MFNRKEVNALAQQVAEMEAEKMVIESKLNEALDTIQAFASKEQTYKKELSQLKNSESKLKAKHEQDMKSLEQSVNRKVNAALASIGAAQFASEQFTVKQSQSDMEAYNTFVSLTGAAQTEFYNKNKEKIARFTLTQRG